jgi:hypothetical protein
MINLKTYEGFFDFFKKKNYDPIPINHLLDCLLPLTDVEKIKSDLSDNTTDGIFPSYETTTGSKKYIYFPKRFTDNGFYFVTTDSKNFSEENRLSEVPNILFFHLQYSPVNTSLFLRGDWSGISDDEVNSIMKECQETLEGFDCQMTFFIGRGMSEGRAWDTEFSDINKMVNKTVKNVQYGSNVDCIRNIIVKIKALGGIEE